MPRIAGVTHAVPKHSIPQSEARAFAQKVFGENETVERLLPVFDSAQIDQRNFSVPMDWFGSPHTFTEVNDLFIETALDLSVEVVLSLARRCKIETTDFDAIFFISTTGLSTPSLDARLFNRIPMNPHIKRVPIWGLGCAAGAAGLARAAEYLRAFPKHRALIVSVELCGLAFRSEMTKSNLVATAIFGDGAAACLMVGDDVPQIAPGIEPQVLGSLSTIYPDTLDVMNWRITSEGFQVGLSRDIPSIVKSLVRENIEEFLEQNDLDFSQIRHWVMHPGGAKVITAYSEALSLEKEALHFSAEVLRDYGNMSSATIFFVLERILSHANECPDQGKGYGLASALGPGFSSELVLLNWNSARGAQ